MSTTMIRGRRRRVNVVTGDEAEAACRTNLAVPVNPVKIGRLAQRESVLAAFILKTLGAIGRVVGRG